MTDPDIAKRNKRNRAAGSRWQSDIRNGFREEGFDIERLALTGSEDEGDHVIRLAGGVAKFLVIEAKAGKMDPAEFVRQTRDETRHFADHRGLPRNQVKGIAVIKRPRGNWKDAYVLTTVRDYFGLGE